MDEDGRVVWLAPYLKVQATYDAKLTAELNQTLQSTRAALRRMAGKEGIGVAVRRAQLNQIEAAIHRLMAELFTQINDTVRAGQHAAAAEAITSGINWDRLLLSEVYTTKAELDAARRNAVAHAPKNVEALILKLRGGGLPLSSQVYRTQALAQGWVTQAINRAIGRGATWRELANDVSRFINPEVPGGVSYAARRLARTEINSAYHTVSIHDAAAKPWVFSMTWHLSRSHPDHDICDTLAGKHYAPADVPAKPHPQCFCYITPDSPTVQQFRKAFLAGNYDAYLRATYGNVG